MYIYEYNISNSEEQNTYVTLSLINQSLLVDLSIVFQHENKYLMHFFYLQNFLPIPTPEKVPFRSRRHTHKYAGAIFNLFNWVSLLFEVFSDPH